MYALVREPSRARLDTLNERWHAGDRVIPVIGDLEEPLLGVGHDHLDELPDSVDHSFRLAALYDMSAPAHRLAAANLRGTWHAVQLANRCGSRGFTT